jgi:hypothetical protein
MKGRQAVDRAEKAGEVGEMAVEAVVEAAGDQEVAGEDVVVHPEAVTVLLLLEVEAAVVVAAAAVPQERPLNRQQMMPMKTSVLHQHQHPAISHGKWRLYQIRIRTQIPPSK